MSDPCPDCPCPAECLKWPIFCEWARSGDALRKRHICGRSAMRHDPAPTPAPTSGLAGDLARLKGVQFCPFRSNHPPCGCAGARCALKIDPMGPADPPRRGAVVAIQECLECVKRYG